MRQNLRGFYTNGACRGHKEVPLMQLTDFVREVPEEV
jgi:hypothetical protein